MIDEDALRQLLADAADAAPAPGRRPEDLLATLTGSDGPADDSTDEVPWVQRGFRRPSPRVLGLAAAVVLCVALVAVAISSKDSSHSSRTTALGTSTTVLLSPDRGGGTTGGTTGGSTGIADGVVPTTIPTVSPEVGAPAFAVPSPPALRSVSTPADKSFAAARGAASAAGGSVAAPAAAAAAPLTDSAKVVKTGSLELQVRKGGFATTIDAITTKTIGLGGYVADSTTATTGNNPSGTVTVRVPSTSFDNLLIELRKLGKVLSVTQKGTEVSAQYTDLQARLAAQTATRDRLNVVLSKANNVQDILSVQDRITQVQTEIEQLQGQIRLLDDQTSMGTLAVSVAEPGAKPPVIQNPDDRTIGSAFSEARHHFGNAIEAVIAWSGSAVAVLLFGLVALLLARLAWPRLRRFFLL